MHGLNYIEKQTKKTGFIIYFEICFTDFYICSMGNAYQIKDQTATYYLTFQVVGWADVFSRQIYRDIIIQSFRYCREKKELEIFAYVIMTNHVHVIMRGKEDKLSDLVREFKKFSSKQILKEISYNNKESRREWLEKIFKYHAKFNKRAGEKQLWTHENHAVELSTNEMIDSRLNYIHENPVRAGWVKNPEDYLYSSARNYADMECLIEIDKI
jgi:REP element-mobilizing transposase RayT